MATKLPESTIAASLTSEPEKLLPVIQADREAAWPHRPFHMTDTVATVRAWNAGEYDNVSVVQAFAKHRLSSPVSGTDMVRNAVAAALDANVPVGQVDARVRSVIIANVLARLDGALSASPSTPIPVIAEARERDLPALFEAWWRGYEHGGQEPARYSRKKHIAFDAFCAALSTSATLDNTAAEVVPLEAVIALVDAEMNERVAYFERTSGHYDRKQAAGSYRATGEKLVRAIATLTAKTEKAE